MKKSTTFIISTYLLLATSFVYAQAPAPAKNQATQQPQPKMFVLADVRVTDVTFKESNGTYTGGFNIMSNMGMQNGIGYGVVVVDTVAHKQISYERLGIVPSLKEGEMIYKPFTYTLPPLNASKVQVLLVAESDAGLRYSTSVLANDLTVIPKAPFATCSQEKNVPKVVCHFNQDVSYSFTESEGLFSLPLITGTSSSKKGETKTFDIKKKAGNFYFTLEDTTTKEVVSSYVTFSGVYGSIQNVVVTKKDQGVLLTVTAFASSEDTSVNYILKDKNGTSCGYGSKQAKWGMLQEFIATKCTEGVITVALFDAKNERLDQKTDNFSVVRVAPKVATKNTQSKNTTRMYILIAIFALIVIASLIIRKVSGGKLAKVASVSMFFLVMSLVSVEKGEALNYGGTYGNGSMSFNCGVNVSFDKSTYQPSETAVITISDTITNIQNVGSGACDVWYPGSFDTSAPLQNSFLETVISSPSGAVNNTQNFNMVVPASATTHYFTSGVYLHASNPPFSSIGNILVGGGAGPGDFYFDVVPATPPAVNLNFSAILNSAKHSLTSVIVALKESVIGVAEAKTR